MIDCCMFPALRQRYHTSLKVLKTIYIECFYLTAWFIVVDRSVVH